MRAPVRLYVLCLSWLPGLMANQPTSAESVDLRIGRLLKEAMAAPTKVAADQKLNQAEDLLKRTRRTTDQLDYSFRENDIMRTRGLVSIAFWQRSTNNTSLHDEGRRWLLRVLNNYDQLAKQCEGEAGAMEEQLSNGQLSRNKRYKEIRGNISRAHYKKAWTEYALGATSDSAATRKTYLENALNAFARFTTGGYRNHPVVADCFYGQALCCYELKDYSSVRELLALETITPNNIPPGIFKGITRLRVKTYQAISSHQGVEDSTKQYFDTLPDSHEFDAIELEMAVARARSLAALVIAPAAQRYRKTYQARLDEVRKLVDSYGEPWRTKLAKELGKTGLESPFASLVGAQEHFNAKRYVQALEEAERGLEVAGKEIDEDLRAELRYVKFAAYWNLDRWSEAHLAGVDFLRYHQNDGRAAEICDMAIRSGIEALKANPPLQVLPFLHFLEFAETNFPKIPEVQRTPWYRAHLLLQDGQYLAASKILKTITPTSPVYRQAQYDLALVYYKQVETITATAQDSPRDATKLLWSTAAALGRFADTNPKKPPEAELPVARAVVDLAIKTADRLLHADSPDPNAVLAFLDRMQPLQDIINRSEDRWLALRVKANILTGNIDSTTKLIDALLIHNPSQPNVASALIDIANLLEHKYARSSENKQGADAARIDQKLVGIYTVLLNHMRNSKDEQMHAQEPSARLCLARCLLRLGHYRRAIDHYEFYVNNVPQEKAGSAIRGLAIAYERTDRYDLALQQWRKLYKGLRKQTDGWLEAGYRLIQCHLKAGHQDHARRLLTYFKMQCAQMELGEWSQKLKALEKECLPANLNSSL